MGLSSNIVGGVSTLTVVVVVSVVAKWLASVRERNHKLQMAQLRTQLDAMVQRANAMVQRANAAQHASGIQNDMIRTQNRRIHLAQKSQFVPRPARERSHKVIDIFRTKLTASNNVLVEISNDDRISLLPDGVLCHILSFLPTKFSVRTSILSTRWKQLFTFVPNLHFEFDSSSTIISFMHFVNSIFMCYNISRMNKFRFYFFIDEHVPENFPMASWMSAAIGRHVQEINIHFDCLVSVPIDITLPLDLFTCKTLTILKLSGTFMVELPTSVCLPCLKKCELCQVRFNNESARNLFQSCPVLEYLVLRSCCFGDDVEVLNISSPVLKNLIIVGSGDTYHLMLNLSNLLTFSYVGPASEKFLRMESSLKSVVHASIYYYPDSSTKDGAFAELLCSLCHVQVLVLTCQEFIHSGHSLPKFNNLTSLYLGIAPTVSLLSRLLLVMLDNSPRLQFLTICQGCDENEVGENSYVLPEHVPECVSLHLKGVDLTFIGSDYERKLIKYFLKYANNLYWMRIKSELKWNEQLEISSAACRVIFS